MARILTDRACTATRPAPDKDKYLSAGNALSLRIRPNGTRTWVVDYLHQGRRKKITIGEYSPDGSNADGVDALLTTGILSLAQARLIAENWKQIRRAGRDPGAEWEARKAATTQTSNPTVNAVIDNFDDTYVKGKKSAHCIRYRLNLIRSKLGARAISEVSHSDVITTIESIAQGRREGGSAKQLAGEVLSLIKRVWRFAESREWIEESRIERLKRRDFDARPQVREVTLRLDEVARVWKTLEDRTKCKSSPEVIFALKLLILTGQRENEVVEARWSEFDLDRGFWTIPAQRTKAGRAHLVHLSPQAVAILREIRRTDGDSEYVFATKVVRKNHSEQDKPIWGRSVNNALQTLFKKGALEGITPCCVHDFRRTLISRLPDLGFEGFIGHKIANHKMIGVMAHYNHANYYEQRRAALIAWASEIDCATKTLSQK